MKNRFLGCLLPLLFVFAATAQNIHPKLDSLLRKTLNDRRNSLNVKGLGAAIQFSDGKIWQSTAGISEENPTVELDSTYQFGLASVTKTITSAAILQLADEGVLSVGDSLHAWLDTFNFISPDITIRQLLRHQSGIFDVLANPNFQNELWADKDSVWQLADVVKTFIQAPNFQPGSGWQYSNTNYILLGMIIEKAAGKPYFQVFRERFFDPLNLASAAALPFETAPFPIAHIWLDLNADGIVDDAHDLLSTWHSFDAATGPAGSTTMRPRDVAIWMRAFLGANLLSPAMLADAKTTVATSFPGGTKYGLGIMERKFLNFSAFGHGGDSGNSVSAWYFPEKDISIVVMNNDARKNSWQIAPVVQALLQNYLDCETMLPTAEPAENLTANWQIMPNPFSEKLTISLEIPIKTAEIRVVFNDFSGKRLAEKIFSNLSPGQQRLVFDNLAALPKGLLVANVFSEKGWLGARQVLRF